tara:strand:- start:100 stop:606 length:507 start_codon:yes stop_codon:yes gene_type:complete
MTKNNKNILIFLIAICLPVFIISSPDWLEINGIGPCWPVIILLPFSLKSSPWISAITSIFLASFMDSFTVSEATYIPSLLLLSLLWSRYALHNKKIELFSHLGLMSILGTGVVGFSMWAQKIILNTTLRDNWFHSWSFYVLICEMIITGLVAPFFSSWLIFAYKKYRS